MNCASLLLSWKKVLLQDAPKRELLETRLSNFKIHVPILPCMIEAILLFPFPLVSRRRPQLVSASGRPKLRSGVRLLARLGPPRGCGCLFRTRCSHIIDEI